MDVPGGVGKPSAREEYVAAANELSLAVLGVIATIGLGAASIGISAYGWIGGLLRGVGSLGLVLVILKNDRLRTFVVTLARGLTQT